MTLKNPASILGTITGRDELNRVYGSQTEVKCQAQGQRVPQQTPKWRKEHLSADKEQGPQLYHCKELTSQLTADILLEPTQF